jgi:hypothetical protein
MTRGAVPIIVLRAMMLASRLQWCVEPEEA